MANRWLPSVATLSSLSMALLLMAPAHAVELGNVSLQSASGQPLMATVQLSDTDGLTASDITVQVASAADFERFSLERIAALDMLQIEVDFSGAAPVLRLRSPVTINEPFISLVLDTRWPAGRVLTEYTLRLESPAFSSSGAATATIAPVRSVQEPLPELVQDSTQPAVTAPDVLAPETPASVSNAPVDSQTSASRTSAPQAPSAGSSATAPAMTAAAATAVVSNASTITVNAGDTLWELAQRVRPDSSVSVQQTMLALQRLNPEAFIGGNINRVRRGEILQVPELSQIRELAATEAVNEVNRQNQVLAAGAAATPSQPVTTAPSGAPAGAGAQGELRVVTVADDSDGQPADASAAGSQSTEQRSEQIESLEDRIALGEEDLARLDVQNDELNARLALLEQQIASAREIIRLRDLELAQLQQQLASEPDAVPAPDVPPPVITMAPDAGPLQRAINVLTSNTWAMLGAGAVLVLLLVLLMVRRNRAAAESKAQASARENDSMSLGADDEELLFAGVAEAAAESAAGSADDKENKDILADIETTPAAEGAALYTLVEESTASDGPEDSDKTHYNNKVQEEFEENLKVSVAQESEFPAATDLSDPELDDWQPREDRTDATDLDSRYELDESTIADTARADFAETIPEPAQPPAGADTSDDLINLDTGADMDWPDEDKTGRAGDEFDISLPDDTLPASAADADAGKAAGQNADEYDDLAFLPSEDDFTDLADVEDEEDFDFLLDSDEAATKLDLARAYIDMGDSDGAREILDEVLNEGTEVQRKEAQDLLGRL